MVSREGRGRRAALASQDHALLAPPWAPTAAVVAVLVTALIARLVWHSRQLPVLDAWVEDELGAHSDREFRLATELATALRAFTVCGIVAAAAISWIALRQWNAVVLALLAPAATLGVETLLKPLVARRAPDSTVFHFPSGHVAVATALALSLVLIVHSARVRPAIRMVAVVSTALLVLLMALARLVETAHLLSDIVGGVTTGVAVTLAAALLLDFSVRGRHLELRSHSLGKAGVQQADREHRQGDHGGGDQAGAGAPGP
jgi:membrane-associated phospholipid phosphatase